MKNSVIYVVIFVCFAWCSAENHLLPSYIKPCNISDPEVHKCLKENIEILRPYLKQGIPDLFIPPLDPLVLPPTPSEYDFATVVTFTDIEVYNIDEFHLDEFDFDSEQNRVNLSIRFPFLRIKSKYNFKGYFLSRDENETGPADTNFTNILFHSTFKGTPFTVNQKSYLKRINETGSILIGDSHLKLEGLFANDTDLENRAKKLLEKNNKFEYINNLNLVLNNLTLYVFGIVIKVFASYSNQLAEFFNE